MKVPTPVRVPTCNSYRSKSCNLMLHHAAPVQANACGSTTTEGRALQEAESGTPDQGEAVPHQGDTHNDPYRGICDHHSMKARTYIPHRSRSYGSTISYCDLTDRGAQTAKHTRPFGCLVAPRVNCTGIILYYILPTDHERAGLVPPFTTGHTLPGEQYTLHNW